MSPTLITLVFIVPSFRGRPLVSDGVFGLSPIVDGDAEVLRFELMIERGLFATATGIGKGSAT
jgi:hypothetical protein